MSSYVVDLEVLGVDLAEESEWVHPEDTLMYCKLALSSEMIVESELLVADCSTSTDELDDLIFHRPDSRPFLFQLCPLTFSVSLILLSTLILTSLGVFCFVGVFGLFFKGRRELRNLQCFRPYFLARGIGREREIEREK